MSEAILDVRNITKTFAGVTALKNVDLKIDVGAIHCLVGENGSGKSTLIKIIGGVLQPDSGSVTINGVAYDSQNLRAIEAIRGGIQIIYQDLALFPNLSVVENISMNQMVEANDKLIKWKEAYEIAGQALSRIEEEIDLNEKVENLSMAKQQIVAITRALTQNARLVIMDEPTSAITREDVDHLFRVILRLKKMGIATLFVSHKLSEVFEIAEEVTVIRDGNKVGDYPAGELDNDKLTNLMTGRMIEYKPYFYQDTEPEKPNLLEVRNLQKSGQYEKISFTLRRGEILGITGLIGSGRTETALSLFGINPPDEGEIIIDGKPVVIHSTHDAIRHGIGYLPEDRLNQGLFQEHPITDNIVVTVLKRLLDKRGLINSEKRKTEGNRWIKELSIKTPSGENPANSLSGGNQQRVVLAKWLATNPKIFILDGPTIGIDIGSKSTIHDIIRRLAGEGMGIIMISDEIQEVLQNCNRVLVMYKGRLVREIPNAAEADEDDVFAAVSGTSGGV
ncbi:MAG: sugar ABC transporter ATP-binding protein [Spirochaetales bacterium]|nr:sugar ABC transporter ATP-binding protein [Spirochaetales bacterium]MCF7936999.1 sugar ABC transporter ATP-binding protein [Spirochaetales bacterium]